MSTSYYAGVVLGVKLDELGVKVETSSIPYNVHDRKGNPTGEIEYERSVKISFQGKESINKRFYSDVFEELIDIKKPLEFFDLNGGYEDFNIDNLVVGINTVNRGSNDWNILKEISIDDKLEIVKSELMTQFGIDVEPKLYFYFQVS